jgi:hypothetical protein
MSAIPSRLLDEAVIADLFSMAGDAPGRAQLQELFRSFFADAQQELDSSLAPGGDLAGLRPRLHRLKGMLGNYGFSGCANFIRRWEDEAAMGDHEGRRRELAELLQHTREELIKRYPWMG